MTLAAWSTEPGSEPMALKRHQVPEAQLEAWLCADPSLAMQGIRWVAQQMVLPDRSRLDLLGIVGDDWVIAELKQGSVNRATLAQALHYLVYLGSMPAEELQGLVQRQQRFQQLPVADQDEILELLQAEAAGGNRRLSILLAGTKQDPDLDLGIKFLESKSFNVPVRVVTYELFVTRSGETVLIREAEDLGSQTATTATRSPNAILQRAEERGVSAVFSEYVTAARDLGLPVKPWTRAITVTAAKRGNPTLLYIKPITGALNVWSSSENLRTYLGFADEDLLSMGPGGDLDEGAARAFLQRFRERVSVVRARASSDTEIE